MKKNIKERIYNKIDKLYNVFNNKTLEQIVEKVPKTENELLEVETNSSKELKDSKSQLDALQLKLDVMLDQIEKDIDEDKKLLKETFKELLKS